MGYEFEDEDESCEMPNEKYEEVKKAVERLRKKRKSKKKLVAYIYDLFQEYMISEEQESELYAIADPEEKYNDCWEYWANMEEENPLIAIAESA